jgi:DNA-directed RNA polymerase subunit F
MVDIEYEIIKEEFVPISKAKDILEKIEEPGYEQKLALEHVKKFAKLSTAESNKLVKELEALNMRKLKSEYIVKIVDLTPKDIDDLKIILMQADIPFKDEELQQIIEVIKKY